VGSARSTCQVVSSGHVRRDATRRPCLTTGHVYFLIAGFAAGRLVVISVTAAVETGAGKGLWARRLQCKKAGSIDSCVDSIQGISNSDDIAVRNRARVADLPVPCWRNPVDHREGLFGRPRRKTILDLPCVPISWFVPWLAEKSLSRWGPPRSPSRGKTTRRLSFLVEVWLRQSVGSVRLPGRATAEGPGNSE